MATKGKLVGYKWLLADLKDTSKTAVIPINFGYHWIVVVVHVHNGRNSMLNHADSINGNGTRVTWTQALLVGRSPVYRRNRIYGMRYT